MYIWKGHRFISEFAVQPEEPNLDDRETEIADDPLLGVIQGEFHAINKRTDVKLLFAVAINLNRCYTFRAMGRQKRLA